jgi:quercetin dioxygenase-like cupin family protein
MTLQTVSRPTDSQSKDDTRQPLTYVPAGTGPMYWGPADRIRFLITGDETGGAFFLAEVIVSPGGGAPPHVHSREEETFRVLEGTLTVRVGGNTVIASPGDVVYLPRGVAHGFQNTGTTDARFLLVVTPAGLEKFFEEGFLPASGDSETRPGFEEAMMARLFGAAQSHGIELAAALS